MSARGDATRTVTRNAKDMQATARRPGMDVPGRGGDARHHPLNPTPPSAPARPVPLLLDYILTACRAATEDRRTFKGAVKLTRGQAEQLLADEGLPLPDGWEAIARRGGKAGHVIGLPAELVATVEESTPWAHGWRPPVVPGPVLPAAHAEERAR